MNKGERQSFGKNERLCKTKLINEIFESGTVFYTPKFKVAWMVSSRDLPSPAQILISIPKKSFRLAVTRNLIKRRIREAYRRKKQILYSFLLAENVKIIFIMVYRHKTVPDYSTMEKSVSEIIEKLCDNVWRNHIKC
jgi:ribonuclease P protein component